MGFLQPLALLGLSAAAIPALLHLLQRRIPPTVPFPAVRYLSETERRHSRRLKLRNLLLLILRTALIAVIVLAAARPVAPLPFGEIHGPSALAVVVDNSLSSGAVVGGRRVVDVIAERSRDVVRRAASSDHLWIVLADGVPRRLTRTEALILLDSLGPEPVRLDLGEAVRAAARVVADDDFPGEVLVLGDLQASSLSPGEQPAARTIVVTPPTTPDNRAVDSVRLTPPVWSPGGAAVVAVGGAGRVAGEVRLEIEGRVAARDLAAPGDRAVLSVDQLATGWHRAQILVGPDELRADDRWHFAVRSAPPSPATVAAGAGPFVAEAVEVLQSAGRVVRGARVTLGDRLAPGRTILLPPDEPAQIGGVNRALAARGVTWRFDAPVRGEWRVDGALAGVEDSRVFQRYRLTGDGIVIARSGGEPWIVRDGDVVIVASRLEESWTTLPVTAGFVPFLDELINRVVARETWRVVGSPSAVVALPPSATTLLGPAGRLAVPADGRVQAPATPGVYFLLSEVGDTVGALEVNHDPRESQLTAATADAVQAALGPDVVLLDADRAGDALFDHAKRADLSPLLLGIALVLAVMELAIASAGGRVRED